MGGGGVANGAGYVGEEKGGKLKALLLHHTPPFHQFRLPS